MLSGMAITGVHCGSSFLFARGVGRGVGGRTVPGMGALQTVQRTAADQLLFAPPFIAAFFASNAALEVPLSSLFLLVSLSASHMISSSPATLLSRFSLSPPTLSLSLSQVHTKHTHIQVGVGGERKSTHRKLAGG